MAVREDSCVAKLVLCSCPHIRPLLLRFDVRFFTCNCVLFPMEHLVLALKVQSSSDGTQIEATMNVVDFGRTPYRMKLVINT